MKQLPEKIPALKIIRLPAVCEIVGLKKTSIYHLPDFPKPIVMGPRAVGWVESEVIAWITAKMAARQQP
jgi:prophage regulatory protein